MTSYCIEVKRCPVCNCQFQADILASSNTFGATFYTDGFVDGTAESTDLLLCPECNSFLWNEDVPTTASFQHTASSLRSVRSLPIASSYDLDYERALREEAWNNNEQEKYIRIRVWWLFNNAYRGCSTENFTIPHDQEVNIRYLLKLLDPNNPKESIMTAEIFRELGQFDDCLQALDQLPNERYLQVVNSIKILSKLGSRQVSTVDLAND